RVLNLVMPSPVERSSPLQPTCSHDAGLGAGSKFSGSRPDEFGLTKVRSTQAHSGLWCPELAQLRPQIVPWSTLCRADWGRNDLVLTMRGSLLRHYHPVSLGAERAHAIIAWSRGGDCGSTNPRILDKVLRLRTIGTRYETYS